ncbi:MAG: sigma-54-dependent Fis family transcriptional regulator, partial [Gammaproteobacteria bacterium]|nr:sigma-54-dependent Fis family transcriptional regulator [Gammaproteobacteria bacterium]
AEQLLLSHNWPGNMRELQNVCQRALLLSQGDAIHSSDLGLTEAGSANKRGLDDIDCEHLRQALLQAGGVVSRAAKQLGISRQALYRRMEYYGIDAP